MSMELLSFFRPHALMHFVLPVAGAPGWVAGNLRCRLLAPRDSRAEIGGVSTLVHLPHRICASGRILVMGSIGWRHERQWFASE